MPSVTAERIDRSRDRALTIQSLHSSLVSGEHLLPDCPVGIDGRMKLPIFLCFALLIVGCHSAPKPEADTTASEAPASKSDPDELPQAVRDAFRRNYPEAKISGVQKRDPNSDSPYYQIQFLQNGMTGTVRFYANGKPRAF